MISIALYNPDIPQNTGNIARLTAGLGIELILTGRLGFSLNDRYLKRAGLDYWEHVKLRVYHDFNEFLEEYKDFRILPATTRGINPYYEFKFMENDVILFGSETKGLPVELLKKNLQNTITIPMNENVRSLNLSNSAAIIAYHALYSLKYFDNFRLNKNFYDLNLKLETE